ncbi:MAG: LysR family transcriptional regulator [Rubrobacter sp.]|nr:LysR family transcriptional regulator [Rubrobacter sp.]
MGLSLQGLRVFVAVVEEGSFSGAGQRLGVSQPAVSNHLRALEKRFGVELLSRGKNVCPTPAGECLASRARRLLEEADSLEEEMANHAAPRGSLVVGASSTPAEFMMPKVAAEFSARYPDVSLELRVYDSEGAVRALLAREVEAAVVGREVEDSRLESRIVEKETLVPVVSNEGEPSPEMSAEEFASSSFVLRERGSATRLAAEAGLASVGVSPNVVMELGSNGAVAGAVAAGVGIGVVPERFAATHPEVRKAPVAGLSFRRPFVLATEKSRSLSPAAVAFIETCVGKGSG